MCEALSEDQGALIGHRVEFVVRKYYGRGANAPPVNLPPESFVSTTECSFLVSGRFYRLETHVVKASDVLSYLVGRTVTYTFDGIEARRARTSPHLPQVARHIGLITSEPDRLAVAENFQSWFGWWVLQQGTQLSFANLMKREPIGPAELAGDGSTQWVFKLPEIDGRYATIRASMAGGRPRLSEVLMEAHESQEMSSPVSVSIHVTFGGVDPAITNLLAASARIQLSHFRADPSAEFWQVVDVQLQSVRPAAIGDAFRVSFHPDAVVTDRRYHLVYRSGQTEMFVDGRKLTCKEPLPEEGVGAMIEGLVQAGTWGPVSGSRLASALVADEDAAGARSRHAVLYWSAFVALTCIVVLLVRRVK